MCSGEFFLKHDLILRTRIILDKFPRNSVIKLYLFMILHHLCRFGPLLGVWMPFYIAYMI